MDRHHRQQTETRPLFIFMISSVSAALVLVALIYGRALLLPIVTAFLVVTLLRAASAQLQDFGVPAPIAMTAALVFLVVPILGIGLIFTGQVDAILQAWPRYVQRFEVLVEQLTSWAGPLATEKVKSALAEFNLRSRVPAVIGTAGVLLGNLLLVFLYVGFLLAGRGTMAGRVDAMTEQHASAAQIKKIMSDIDAGIRQYIWVKTIMSAMTALASYIVLKIIGIDFAESWAILIFFLNYIPSIGSVLGVAFPALLALVQFDTMWQFMVLVFVLGVMQFIIGNVIEPMVMGRSLNLSPFVIITSLVLWSMIWGVAGAFLSVPITAAIVITFKNIPSCRWLAVLLAEDHGP